jgi:hypothetical protein
MTNLPDLPNEILHHVLAQFIPSQAPKSQSFWSHSITPLTLLPLGNNGKEHKNLRQEQHQQKSPVLRSALEHQKLREHLNALSERFQSAPRALRAL